MSKITESARGEACTLRLDKCNGFQGVVFAHKNGAGMGQKYLDEDGNDIKVLFDLMIDSIDLI